MMMKQLIQKAKFRFFEPDGISSGPADHRSADSFETDCLNRPATAGCLSDEQQRIKWLESQVRQLRADNARWKNSSLGFAHEMRALLND